MMTLGITGRSGCGKSTVTAVFAARGIPLADADQLSREILLPGSPLLPRLAERFAARDGISPEMAARRLNAQTSEAVLTARADYILPNASTREALAKAANELCDALIGEGCCA